MGPNRLNHELFYNILRAINKIFFVPRLADQVSLNDLRKISLYVLIQVRILMLFIELFLIVQYPSLNEDTKLEHNIQGSNEQEWYKVLKKLVDFQARRQLDNWGGPYSYIRVLHYSFPLKSIVFTVYEHEYMNKAPPPPIIELAVRLWISRTHITWVVEILILFYKSIF